MFWEGGWEWSRLIGSYDTLGQTPHFYQPDPSLLSARPGRQLASDPNLSVDSSAARNPCVSKIDTAI